MGLDQDSVIMVSTEKRRRGESCIRPFVSIMTALTVPYQQGEVIMMKITISGLICLAIFCYIVSAGTAADEDEDLVLYFTFDDADQPEDMSPAGTPIISYVEPAEVVDGIEGGAWLFDNSTCILLDNPTFEAVFQQSTFSVWLKEPGDDGIVFEEGGSTKGFSVSLISGEVQFATRDNSVQTNVTAEYPNDDNWHFITAIFDSGTMQLYIDGVLAEEESDVPGINSHTDNMGIGIINGQCTCGHSSKFTGIMDEFRITRRALTADEIREAHRKNFAVEPSGKCSTIWGDIKYLGGYE